jgi:SAM-dependent methyltransferase
MALSVVSRVLGRSVRPQRLAVRDGYALWAPTYPPRPHNPLMEVEQSIVAPLIAATASSKPRRALDVGTGSGRCLPLLSTSGAGVVIGVDLSMPMLRRGEDDWPRVCGDACRLPFESCSFDLISSSLMVGDVERLESWIAEAARVLAPGGHLVYSDFHPTWQRGAWRRTFRGADGRSFEMPYFPHQIDEHLGALSRNHFRVLAIREPRLQPARRGKRILERRRDQPVVIVIHAVKSERRRTPARS